jgi:hypothetical protein
MGSKGIVYVYGPAGETAGGTESLYQLIDSINRNGGKSCMVWNKKRENPIPSKYSRYNVVQDEEVEDNENNWIIYPEVSTKLLHTFKNLKKAIWWLSVDYNGGEFQDFSDESITHFYQSFHALKYLQEKNAKRFLPLFDYIPADITNLSFGVSDGKNKEDIVCYNPAKGLEETEKIKLLNPNINFLPIINLDETGVIEALKKSKVYVDFGSHPGRDRLPREAAILGNCIITNFKGSAGYYPDIPIYEKFKKHDVEEVGSLIRDCFNNYESVKMDFQLYKSSILNQKEQLDNQVKQYFIQGF